MLHCALGQTGNYGTVGEQLPITNGIWEIELRVKTITINRVDSQSYSTNGQTKSTLNDEFHSPEVIDFWMDDFRSTKIFKLFTLSHSSRCVP